jgi:hypothetical protein
MILNDPAEIVNLVSHGTVVNAKKDRSNRTRDPVLLSCMALPGHLSATVIIQLAFQTYHVPGSVPSSLLVQPITRNSRQRHILSSRTPTRRASSLKMDPKWRSGGMLHFMSSGNGRGPSLGARRSSATRSIRFGLEGHERPIRRGYLSLIRNSDLSVIEAGAGLFPPIWLIAGLGLHPWLS